MTGAAGACPPSTVVTPDGFRVDTTAEVWRVPTPSGLDSMDFQNLPAASPALQTHLKSFLAGRLAAASPGRIRRNLGSIRGLLASIFAKDGQRTVEELTLADLNSFASGVARSNKSVIQTLSMTLTAWRDTGVPGLAPDLLNALPGLKAADVRGPSPVRTRCPQRGALTRLERRAAMARLREAFHAGRLTLANYANAVLIMSLALRPCQVATIKVRDLKASPQPCGSTHVLRVMRAKQRSAKRGREYRDRKLPAEVGAILQEQCVEARRWAEARGMDGDAGPLFPRGPKRSGQTTERPELAGWESHARGGDLGKRFTRTMSSLGLTSTRTGRAQRITPRRARYTLATLHRAAGGSMTEVQDLLDQTSARATMAYVEPSREVTSRMEAAMASDLRAIASAFGALNPRANPRPYEGAN